MRVRVRNTQKQGLSSNLWKLDNNNNNNNNNKTAILIRTLSFHLRNLEDRLIFIVQRGNTRKNKVPLQMRGLM